MYTNPYKYVSCCSPRTSTSGCPVRLPGECVYYSDSPITLFNINTGDNLNIALNKIATYVENIPISLTASNGLTRVVDDVQLGQTVGQAGNPAILLSNREIPMGSFYIYFNNGRLLLNTSTDNSSAFQMQGVLDIKNLYTPIGGVKGRIDSNGVRFIHTGIGTGSNSFSTYIGYGSGLNAGTGALSNTMIGFETGRQMISSLNYRNTGIGVAVFQMNDLGLLNTGIGWAAANRVTGNYSTYIGAGTASNVNGANTDFNTVIGSLSASFSTTGAGVLTSAIVTLGDSVILGYASLTPRINTTASKLIFIGNRTNKTTDSGSITNTTLIGHDLQTDLSNVCIIGSSQNVIIGSSTTNQASALLQVTSTTQGFLPPRMTTTQKNAIATPVAGLIVYDTTLNKLCVYTNTWETITSV